MAKGMEGRGEGHSGGHGDKDEVDLMKEGDNKGQGEDMVKEVAKDTAEDIKHKVKDDGERS